MNQKILMLTMLLITSYLYAQSNDMKIIEKDGATMQISIDSIDKISFSKGHTHALITKQKNGSENETILTNIEKIVFSTPITHVEQLTVSSKTKSAFKLAQNYPNPFNPTTFIKFELPANGWINIQIFNVNGQLIKSLIRGSYGAGVHQVEWDGNDDYGQIVANGVYFYRAQFDNTIQMRKLLFLK